MRKLKKMEKNTIERSTGFKLDLDGAMLSAIVNISRRFYPPKANYGSPWIGTVHIELMGRTVVEKEFDYPTLEDLKQQVEFYVQTILTKVEAVLQS